MIHGPSPPCADGDPRLTGSTYTAGAPLHHTQRPTLLVHRDSDRDDEEAAESGRDLLSSAGGS